MTPSCCAVHVHTTLCDGKDTPEAMAAAAYDAGVRHLGFSCHSHTPIPDDEGAVLPADMAEYRSRVLALREAYAGRMEVLLGLEWDSQSDVSPQGFDYWIGSVHYQSGGGKFYAADWGEAQFAACRDELHGGDALAAVLRPYGHVGDIALVQHHQQSRIAQDGAVRPLGHQGGGALVLQVLREHPPGPGV